MKTRESIDKRSLDVSHENTSNHEDMSRKYRRNMYAEDKGMNMMIGDNPKVGFNKAKIGSRYKFTDF